MAVLVTGGAGFIGSHVCERLIARGERVIAVDSFDPFYDPAIKRRNLESLSASSAFRLAECDILDPAALERAVAKEQIDVVVHLAARTGVRPSIDQSLAYLETNVRGTLNVLELARSRGTNRIVFGSSSSVYGDSAPVPFREEDPAASPISPYAATKRAGELLCHTYHHLHGLTIVCLRFFTVYGPRQRPDLAIHKFTRLMSEGAEIPFFGDGSTERDYTYVDDIVQGVMGAIDYTQRNPGAFEIVNLGESQTTSLAELVTLLGAALGVTPKLRRMPAQPGDVARTFASIDKARRLLGYAPATPVSEGLGRFVEWFRESRLPGQRG